MALSKTLPEGRLVTVLRGLFAIVLLLAFLCAGAYCQAQGDGADWLPGPLCSSDLGLELPNAPIAGDFNLDSKIDVVLSDKSGRIAAVSGDTGEKLWEQELTGEVILTPIWGFFCSALPEIAVLHRDGQVDILRAGTGRVVFSGRLAIHEEGPLPNFSIAPSLLPTHQSAPDTIVAVDDNQRLYRFECVSTESGFQLVDRWQDWGTTVVGHFPRHSPAVDVIGLTEGGPADYVIAFASVANEVLMLRAGAPQKAPHRQPLLSTTRFAAQIALVEDKNGLVTRVFANDPQRGLIHFPLSWDGSAPSRPVRLGNRTIAVQAPHPPIASPDITGDGVQEVLLYGPTQVYVVNGADGLILRNVGEYQPQVRNLLAGGACVERASLSDRRDVFAILPSREEGWVLLDMRDLTRVVPAPGLPGDREVLVREPAIFDGNGDSKADVLVFDTNGGVHLLGTTININRRMPSWSGERGSSLRSGGYSQLYFPRRRMLIEQAQRELSILVERAVWALEAGAYRKALDAADEALEMAPREERALRVRQAAWWGAHRPQLFFLAIALAAVLGIGAIIFWRIFAQRRLLHQTRLMVEDGRIEKISPAFQRHFKLHKWQPELVRKFADICYTHSIQPLGMTDIFERAHHRRPDDIHVVTTLAGLYLAELREDDEAVDVYEQTRSHYRQLEDEEGDRLAAPFEYMLGNIYLAREQFELARERLEAAYRLGVHDEKIFVGLARTYLGLGLKTPRHLPIILRALKSLPQDADILEGAAECYMAARQQRSPKAQEVFQRLALVKPDSVLANEQIANLAYWSGDYQKAQIHARRVLSIEEDSAIALQVLSWCLWREEKMDEESRDIYQRAYKHFAQDANIVRANAEIALLRDRPQDDDLTIIERTLEAVSSDMSFLSRVAASCLRWGESDSRALYMARKALERLDSIDALTEEQTLRLAALYVEAAQDATEGLPRADGPENNICDILSKSFDIDPEAVPGLTRVLGAMLIRLERHDPQYIDVFETLVEEEAHQPIWAIELATILHAQEYYERVLEVLPPVLDYNPDLDSSLSEDTQSTDTSSPISLRSHIHRLLAAAHANLKEFNKAIDYYQSLLEANPDDPQAIVGMGTAYARMSETTEEMDAIISRAREIAPEDALLNYAVGERLAEENRWDAATTCLITALKGDESYTDQILRLTSRFVGRLQGEASIPARWMRVSVLQELGHYETLLDELEMIDVLDKTERTRILMLFQEILKEAPGNIEALYGRGRILRRLGRYPQARRSLEEALRQDPDYLPAKRMLLEVYSEILKEEDTASLHYAAGQIAMQLEDYDRAVTAFQKARSDPGFERMSRRHLAECFLRKGLIELALVEFQNIAVDNEMKPLLYQLANEFEGVGNVFGARQSLQLIYSLDAGYRDVAERLNRLAQSSQANPELLAQMAAEQRAAVQEQAGMPDEEAQEQGEVARQIDKQTRYDLEEEIGRGAMASVYRAMDNELEEIIALKILPESLIKNPEALRRFRLEARASRKLSHDNIVRIHDIGEEKGRKYISMEFVEGKTLKDLIRAAARDTSTDVPRIAINLLADYARQIASGMQYAHEQGIIHRDLKPANIMINPEGKVKVADFGIAKAVEASDQSQGTITGAIVGTPLYMSPEQIMGETCDRRTDIYSFGVLLYEAIIGHAPFNQGDLAYQHLHVEPEPLPSHIDSVFAEVVMKCLEKDPEQRWQNFEEILKKLSEMEA